MLYWVTAIAALVAVWLNIRRHVACFWIWLGTNSVWTYADLVHDLHAQAALQAVYVALSVYGICSWSRSQPQGAEK
jgi:nicotinamide mononucleotide transporter